MKKITIAIDGLSSCGKSTIAKQLARKIGYLYVDTGAMYRTVTLYALRNRLLTAEGKVDVDALKEQMRDINISFQINASSGENETYLNGKLVEKDIRTMEVSEHVSAVAAIPSVREALVARQKEMGRRKGVVMDGRDIGTTVFPDAELKIFVTARLEVRARRRFDELRQKGIPADYEEVLRNVQERDYIDTHRAVSPLRKADDAIELDNSDITIAGQQAWILGKFMAVAGA